jgi:hypothetical protein
MKEILFNNKLYKRDFDMIGDNERVRWYELNPNPRPHLLIEIFNQKLLDELEKEYEQICLLEILPTQPII